MSQADDYAHAIDLAMNKVTARHDNPLINAILGALATRAGDFLAMVADPKTKEIMFGQVCAEIKRAMAVPAKNQAILIVDPAQEGKHA